jgi:bifunctional ADP-heptose synthase (sugar kinase/adenylyltransferase)
VVGWLQALRGLNVLVVGEAILDEYHYCETLGKSGKEPILATRYLHQERFAGGILAVANNVAAFTGRVTALTVLGQQDGRPDPSEPFLRASLDPAVELLALYQAEAPTLTKRRYVEQYPLQKLFEVYYLKHMEEDGPEAAALCARLEAVLDGFDAVVVVDYGHGMIGPRAVRIVCTRARFLAVNTQSNADNQGFNTISKYPRADFISLSERELRLEARSRARETGQLMEETAAKLGCRSLLVTRGKLGNLLYDRRCGIVASPNLSAQVVDRVGAGDAVLSVAALCAAREAPPEVLGFLGNVVGAHAVATVGHRRSLDLGQLSRTIHSLLG